MRTYSREDWLAAQEAWAEGEFSDEWKPIRHVMAMQGCIFPPAGDAFDSWEVDQPSQRAVLIRALRETPELLRRCSRKSTSWSQVIDRLFAARDVWREDLYHSDLERDEAAIAAQPTHREAVQALGAIWRRIGDSV